jgi:hypothetical protein
MPRIALVYDSPGWAFHRIAIQVAMHSTPDLSMTLIPSGAPRSWSKFHSSIASEFDWYHYFWRGAVDSLVSDGAINISTSVYDHQFLDNEKYTRNLLGRIPFYVASQKLLREYSRIFPSRSIPAHSDGVDTNFFYPRTPVGETEFLRVGWVGNSKWGNSGNKGFKEIFLGSIHKTKELGLPIQAVVADASNHQRTHLEMEEFYQGIDVLCCTSQNEGTPNPILESSAAGRAWISTNVGIVPELAGELQRNFIVDRSVDSFVQALKTLTLNRALVKELGAENRLNVVREWAWEKKGSAIGEFLRKSISSQ